MALQIQRTKDTEAVAARWQSRLTVCLAKRYPSILILVFVTGCRYFLYQAATQLSLERWVVEVPDAIH